MEDWKEYYTKKSLEHIEIEFVKDFTPRNSEDEHEQQIIFRKDFFILHERIEELSLRPISVVNLINWFRL